LFFFQLLVRKTRTPAFICLQKHWERGVSAFSKNLCVERTTSLSLASRPAPINHLLLNQNNTRPYSFGHIERRRLAPIAYGVIADLSNRTVGIVTAAVTIPLILALRPILENERSLSAEQQ
jgi:hypothetical protein